MKYLEYYKKVMKTGKLLREDPNGLCGEGFREAVDVFRPDAVERGDLSAYWASGVTEREFCDSLSARRVAMEDFTPMRQNIVLFLAAMEGEL